MGSRTAEFPPARWAGVSAAAMDLTQRLLQPRSADRLPASSALQHPWFTASGAASAAAGTVAAGEGGGEGAADEPLRTPAVLRETTGARRFFMAAPVPLAAMAMAGGELAAEQPFQGVPASAANGAGPQPVVLGPPWLDLSASTLAKRRKLRSTASSSGEAPRTSTSSGVFTATPPAADVFGDLA